MKKQIALFALTFIMFSIYAQSRPVTVKEALPSVSGENTEDEVLTLKQIDRYINDVSTRDFQKALLELNKYLAFHPEQFDAVQRRIRKILNSREHYVELSNELMRLIRESSEEDNEDIDSQMIRLTERILSLERYPKDSRLEIVKDTNYLVSLRKYSAVQNRTANLVQEGQFVQAAKKAREGLEILYENFKARYEGQNIESEVVKIVDSLSQKTEQFSLLYDRFHSAVDSYVQAVETDSVLAAKNALVQVSSVFAEFSVIRNAVLQDGLSLSEQAENIKKRPNIKSKTEENTEDDKFLRHGDEYISFAEGCVFGWKENPSPERGILGVLDTLWTSCVEEMKIVSAKAINKNAIEFASLSSVESFRNNSVLPGTEQLERIKEFSSCARTVNELYSSFWNREHTALFSVPQNFVISVDYAENLALHTKGLVNNLLDIAEINRKGEAVQTPTNAGESLLTNFEYVQRLKEVSNELNALSSVINGTNNGSLLWANEYQNAVRAGNTVLVSELDISKKNNSVIYWEKITQAADNYITGTNEYASSCDSSLYEKIALFFAQGGTDFVDSAKNYDEQLKSITSGTKSLPKETVAFVSTFNSYIEKTENILHSYNSYSDERYKNAVQNSENSIHESINSLESFKKSNALVLEHANELIAQADRYRSQAEQNIALARRYYSEKKYDSAREQTNSALDLYRESLKYSYDESLATSSENTVVALLTNIDEAQKLIIENEVNSLIAQANREYRNDNYTKAQDSLNLALERWNLIFQDYTNYEIANLQAIVENALSANSGREVLSSDSLYFDVSQMLRSANQNFSKAQTFVKKGNPEQAEAEFNSALQTLEVLHSLVPRNREANILRFKIMQFQNPKEFEEDFAERVTTAISESKTQTDKNKLSELYGDLFDLAEINPNYKGLSNAILELEYVLGKKERPNALLTAKKEAANLAATARSAYRIGNYSRAFDLINQAIAKDSSNAEYKTFRTTVNKARQTVVSIKSPDYSDKINEINERFSRSDINGAYDIVEELWKNSANRTDELKKMRQRIERMRA